VRYGWRRQVQSKLATDLGAVGQAQAGVSAMLKLAQVRVEPAEYQRIAA
jgi:hypothetical protein